MKSNSGTKRKVASGPSDFKRRKAKVGKKALKPANETSTEFKSASIHVSGQKVHHQDISGDGAVTDRGRSIADLFVQLRHPAPAVRASAIKGLTHLSKSFEIRSKLHLFLEAFSRALVDEEQDVRTAGLNLLRAILKQENGTSLASFLNQVVAYTSSALNSLDLHMRLDGARAVLLFGRYFATESSRESVTKLLLPFVSLLSEREPKDVVVIVEAVVCLLSACLPKSANGSLKAEMDDEVDFVYSTRGRSRNALMTQKLYASRTRRSIEPAKSISTLYYGSSENESMQDKTWKKLSLDLFTKLRNILMEVLGQDDTRRTKDDEFYRELFASSIQGILLLLRLDAIFIQENAGEKSQKVKFQVAKVLMESFPLTDTTLTTDDNAEQLNASITKCVQGASRNSGMTGEDLKTERAWQDQLETYWLNRFQSEEAESIHSLCLDIFNNQIVEAKKNGDELSSYQKLISTVKQKFLPMQSEGAARSAAGRRAIQLLASEATSASHSTGFEIAAQLPQYLVAWGTDYLVESCHLFEALKAIVQQMDNTESSKSNLALIRKTLVPIASRREGKRTALLEDYPENLRTRFLGLICMLGSPPSAMITAFGTICSRKQSVTEGSGSTEGSSFEREVFETVKSLRKSISLPEYLTFIVRTIGVPGPKATQEQQKTGNALPSSYFFQLDAQVCRAAQELIRCGAQRSFAMLSQQFVAWLKVSTNGNKERQLLRIRVGLSMVAALSSDMKFGLDHTHELWGQQKGLQSALTSSISYLAANLPVTLSEEEREKLLAPSLFVMELSPKFADVILIGVQAATQSMPLSFQQLQGSNTMQT